MGIRSLYVPLGRRNIKYGALAIFIKRVDQKAVYYLLSKGTNAEVLSWMMRRSSECHSMTGLEYARQL